MTYLALTCNLGKPLRACRVLGGEGEKGRRGGGEEEGSFGGKGEGGGGRGKGLGGGAGRRRITSKLR